ncbi:Uncaracterized surface protein containing fasciclin (FAS1) repeats [Maribacter aquivivus]|uniref:Uncaracterized surface protein containing fasciclin (FAS1) repeats n=1 Tax=Maribacter aquivivus TaxID=228958 RepID=A0A1M6QZM6_9FLAO|nr:fasciclin domain-containing protein [Maribacter aquivivus]SHK25586.1 Uncaracterized surface protein containing fasciclin (FAS1) repeats [Maribacter aquivivus]
MKKWTSLMSLCALFLGIQTYAQDNAIDFKFENLISTIQPEKSIIERTASFENHSSLLNALRATNLDKVLDYTGEFTVFAPSNLAFEKLSKATIDKLFDPENKKALKAMLSYHIIADKLSASSILKAMCRGNGIAKFTTIQGDKITATMKGIDIVLTDKSGNSAIITTADSNQSNGIIHEVDTVFVPEKML